MYQVHLLMVDTDLISRIFQVEQVDVAKCSHSKHNLAVVSVDQINPVFLFKI